MNSLHTSFILLLSLLLSLSVCRAQDGNPRHPGVVHFEKIGTMSGSGIVALPDINGDGIADFSISRGGQLWLYRGRLGGLPEEASGVRLGPTEMDSETRILAVGDWDGMNGVDLCARIELKNDTSFNNTEGYQIFRIVIFWNNGNGDYSLNDTTRLSPGVDASFGPLRGTSADLDKDNIEDLVLRGGSGLSGGVIIRYPALHIFKGHSGGRWGRDGIANTPDWQWWNAPNTSRLDAEDLDMDGAIDVILYHQDIGPRPLSVLYGRHDGALPDTLEDLQQIDMQTVGGQSSNFADVTGDQVPDLLVLNQSQSLVYIYVGCKGQRLLEQFGTGNDPPQDDRWWGKPWAALKGPNLVSSAWFGFGRQLFDLGSADTNQSEEIWVVSTPSLLCYEVTGWVAKGVHYGLDSLFDGEIESRLSDARRVGDIDGSGRSSFALLNSSGVHFYRTAESVRLPTPTFWRIPACDTSLSTVHEQGEVRDVLAVEVIPNPSSGEVRVRWRSGEPEKRSGNDYRA